MMTAIIDKGVMMETVGGIEAYMVNHRRDTVDLYRSPTDKITVDTARHKLILKQGQTPVIVIGFGGERVVS